MGVLQRLCVAVLSRHSERVYGFSDIVEKKHLDQKRRVR